MIVVEKTVHLSHYLRLLFLYLLALMPLVAMGAPAAPEPTITFTVPEKFYVGLPVTVTVEVKNNASHPLQVLMPQDIYTLSYELYQGGKPFERNVQYAIAWQPDWVRELAPGEKVQGTCGLDRYFYPNLPTGNYTGQIRYLYQRSPRREVVSEKFHFAVVEPTTKEELMAQELFFKGRTSEHGIEQYGAGIEAYAQLIQRFPDSDYARIGALKKALAHYSKKEYEQAIKSFRFYLDHLPRIQGRFSRTYVEYFLGDCHYKLGNSITAKSIIVKLLAAPELNFGLRSQCENLLKRIDEERRMNEVF